MKRLVAIFAVFAILMTGCGETKTFTPAQPKAEGTDDKIEHIGSYSISEGNGNSLTVKVYHVTINGKKREVHWGHGQHSSVGVISLEGETE